MVYASGQYVHAISLPVNATETQVRATAVAAGFSRVGDIDYHFRLEFRLIVFHNQCVSTKAELSTNRVSTMACMPFLS